MVTGLMIYITLTSILKARIAKQTADLYQNVKKSKRMNYKTQRKYRIWISSYLTNLFLTYDAANSSKKNQQCFKLQMCDAATEVQRFKQAL